jgi:hypothetical protein
MQKHEHFEELCALAAVGDIPRADQDALMEHLATCVECRQSYQDYCILLHELPSAESAVERLVEPTMTLENALKERFWARAKAENIGLSREAEKELVPRQHSLRLSFKLLTMRNRVLWAVAATLFVVGAISLVKSRRQESSAYDESAGACPRPYEPQPSRAISSLSAQVTPQGLQPALVEHPRRDTQLASRLSALETQIETLEKEKGNLEDTISDLTAKNTELQAQGGQNLQLAAQRQAELEKLRAERDQLMASQVANQILASDLSEKIKVQTASVDRDRQLLSADRDIRDLMGARSLHIIDVHDADSRGKDKKAFGRVFFTEGKSLIFYAFDLDENKVLNAKFSYQAWGERNGKPESARNLGIFYADDRVQKRWVLKVDDPNELDGIDSVFVTLEPSRDSEKPSGRKLLYAFLNGQANHP